MDAVAKRPWTLSLSILILILLALFSARGSYAQDAEGIITNVVDRFVATPRQAADITIRTTNIRGNEVKKQFELYLSSRGSGKIALRRTPHKEGLLLVVQGGDFEKALYWNTTLSSVTRINLRNQDTPFAGTAFSYEDIKQLLLSREDTTRFEYSVSEEADSVWNIRAVSRSSAHSQYDHRILTVRKSDYAVVGIRGFTAGERVRAIQFADFRVNENGTPQPRRIIANFFRRSRKLITSTVIVRYKSTFPPNDPFTQSFITGVR